jgi:hypothetical protein
MGFLKRILAAVGIVNGRAEPATAEVGGADACAQDDTRPPGATPGDCGACEAPAPEPPRRETKAIMKQMLDRSSEERKKNAGTLRRRLDLTQRLLDEKLEEKGRGYVGG